MLEKETNVYLSDIETSVGRMNSSINAAGVIIQKDWTLTSHHLDNSITGELNISKDKEPWNF